MEQPFGESISQILGRCIHRKWSYTPYTYTIIYYHILTYLYMLCLLSRWVLLSVVDVSKSYFDWFITDVWMGTDEAIAGDIFFYSNPLMILGDINAYCVYMYVYTWTHVNTYAYIYIMKNCSRACINHKYIYIYVIDWWLLHVWNYLQ